MICSRHAHSQTPSQRTRRTWKQVPVRGQVDTDRALPRVDKDTALQDIAARYRCQRCGERSVLVRAINPQTDIEKGGM